MRFELTFIWCEVEVPLLLPVHIVFQYPLWKGYFSSLNSLVSLIENQLVTHIWADFKMFNSFTFIYMSILLPEPHAEFF